MKPVINRYKSKTTEEEILVAEYGHGIVDEISFISDISIYMYGFKGFDLTKGVPTMIYREDLLERYERIEEKKQTT